MRGKKSQLKLDAVNQGIMQVRKERAVGYQMLVCSIRPKQESNTSSDVEGNMADKILMPAMMDNSIQPTPIILTATFIVSLHP